MVASFQGIAKIFWVYYTVYDVARVLLKCSEWFLGPCYAVARVLLRCSLWLLTCQKSNVQKSVFALK